MLKSRLFGVLLGLIALPLLAQVHSGTIKDFSFFSPSLAKDSKVRVYLPPNYHQEDQNHRYPVIYFLHGASSGYEAYSFVLPLVDFLWRNERLDPCILVMPDGHTEPFNGSFYTNSSLYGKFEDLLSKDLIPLIDSSFNTRKNRNFRAISGHSMGAYGAFKQAFKHPELYGAVAGLSGPLNIVKLDMLIPQIKEENGSPPYEWRHTPGMGVTNLIFTMAGAFSPNPQSSNYVNFPLDEEGQLIDSVLRQWKPHNPVEMAKWLNPSTDLAVYFDCGLQDEYQLYLQNRAFSDSLLQYGIKHIYSEYNGTHLSGLPIHIPLAFQFIDEVFKAHENEINKVLMENQMEVSLYPNPVREFLYFEAEDPLQLSSIRIFSSTGQLIRRVALQENPINVSKMPEGIYQILFDYSRISTARAFVKLH